MRTARGVWLSAGRRGWSFADPPFPSQAPNVDILHGTRCGRRGNGAAGTGRSGSGVHALVKASERGRDDASGRPGGRAWRRLVPSRGGCDRLARTSEVRTGRPHAAGAAGLG